VCPTEKSQSNKRAKEKPKRGDPKYKKTGGGNARSKEQRKLDIQKRVTWKHDGVMRGGGGAGNLQLLVKNGVRGDYKVANSFEDGKPGQAILD